MIKLTEQQAEQLVNPAAIPPRVRNPRTDETFVLLRLDEYERLQQGTYDDSPLTREELESLAWHMAEDADWDEYEEQSAT